jgi:hypothetical protein
MKQASGKAGVFSHRAITVLGALFCLCASDSAGPRLLPLPALNIAVAGNPCASKSGNGASRTPTPGNEPTAHIEILGGCQYRGRDRQQQSPPATHAPRACLQLKSGYLESTAENYTPSTYEPVSLSIKKDRGPPRST